MKKLTNISRWLVGLLFIVSGLIKLNDPHGTAIKLDEYFVVFSTNFSSIFEWFIPYVLFLSVFLSTLEVVLGLAVLLPFKIKTSIWTLFSMIVFFTFLTFYSAFTGNVTDCGCFGDAMPLTPWQSFSKDLILLVLIAFLLYRRRHIVDFYNPKKTLAIVLSGIISLGFALYCIAHLPIKDFRPYKIGNHIPTLMNDSEPSVYHYEMEKDGETKIFTKYPTDKAWKFVRSIEVTKGKDPTILDFTLFDEENEVTDEVLTDVKLTVVFNSVGELAEDIDWDALQKLKDKMEGKVITISSKPIANEKYKGILPSYYAIDETVAKAMIRSNPGLMLWKDGTVLGKWHINDIPSIAELNDLIK